jgi:hypothetical protein
VEGESLHHRLTRRREGEVKRKGEMREGREIDFSHM